MKRISTLTLAALLMTAPVAWGWSLNCTRVRPIPPEACGPCPDACSTGLCPTIFPPEHAQRLIEVLQTDDNFAHRECAVDKLGSPLHAAPCRCPEVFEALIGALQCDKAWEVRRAAAIAIRHQHLVCRNALLALYIASKTDPHFTVRFKAAESLDILTVPYAPGCFKELREHGDQLIAQLRKQGYRPGSHNCRVLLGEACASCGVAPYMGMATPTMVGQVIMEGSDRAPVVLTPQQAPEAIPLPKGQPR
jgi:HEAT repeats